MPVLDRITVFCFAASYAVALVLELVQLLRPRPIQRLISLAFGGAGLLAHTIYLAVQPLDLGKPFGSLVFLAWILAIFYLYGTVHHGRLAWGMFVLPLVVGLIVLAAMFPQETGDNSEGFLRVILSSRGERFWGMVHGGLVLLAAVGVCVGFVASIMYLVQAHRLKAKVPPGQGVRLLSLERLEEMNRRAILWAFPLLTAGLIVGMFLQVGRGDFLVAWDSPKILGSLGLWLVFAILLYLRYGLHARGRQVALLTVMAFAVLLFALVSPVHPFLAGGATSGGAP
jgi:ABC-type transport system involved in cytochrome c biogenesis permease subunit